MIRETSGDKKMTQKTRMGFDAQLMECVHTHTHTHKLQLCDPYCNLSARRVEKVASRFINNRIKMVRHGCAGV